MIGPIVQNGQNGQNAMTKEPFLTNVHIASRRARSISNVARYRTYLVPPSNPFREGKSKLQILRETLAIISLLIISILILDRIWHGGKSQEIITSNSALKSTHLKSYQTADVKAETFSKSAFQTQLEEFRSKQKEELIVPNAAVDETNAVMSEEHVENGIPIEEASQTSQKSMDSTSTTNLSNNSLTLF
jgi:hypothetical protein